MKQYIQRILSFGLACSLLITGYTPAVVKADEQVDTNALTFPSTQQYDLKDGGQLAFSNGARLYVIATDKTLNNAALLEDLKLMSSMFAGAGVSEESLPITFGPLENAKQYDIILELNDILELKDKEQSYQISVDDRIHITSADEIGLFYGMQCVLQTLKLNNNQIYKGTIVDYPDSKERSMHLDIARKYFSMDWIKDLLKEMSYMKMNSLQLHFSENEGFRIQSDTLDSKGITYPSQCYSKAEIAEIVKEAQKYHIDVIPSLDTPGHLRYILNQLPEYSLQGVVSDPAASRTFNIFTNEEAKSFLLDLMDEFSSFFASLGCTRMNIGGDEFLDNFSVLTNDQYIQVMNYFNEAAALVKSHGMTPRAWNDGIRFGNYTGYTLDSDIEICYWSGGNGCASIEEFVKNGHKIVNYVDVYMYYVLAQWWDQYANPQPDKIYNEWYPGRCSDLHNSGVVTPQKFTEPYPDYLLGSSFALWCDSPSYKNEDQVREQIHYRMRSVAEKAWNTRENMPTYTEFKQKVDSLGTTPGTVEDLPEPGVIFQDSDMPTVTLKYEDMDHNPISADEIYYGLADSAYQFDAKQFYGYQFQHASEDLSGTYEGDKIITLTYKLAADKTELQTMLNQWLPNEDYIPVSYQNYDQTYVQAAAIFSDTHATQQMVDQAVKNLQVSMKDLISIKKQHLYNLVTTAIETQGSYASSSFTTYRNHIKAGEALLAKACSDEELALAISNIQMSKQALVLGDAIAITTSEPAYQTYAAKNAIDGNPNTLFWTSSDQAVGDYFMFTLRDPSILQTIKITQGYKDGSATGDLISGADVMVSTDGNEWSKVGEIKGEHDLTITLDNVHAQYVKFVINTPFKNWVQLNEVSIGATKDPNAANAIIEAAKALSSDQYTAFSFEQMTSALTTLETLITNHATDAEIALATVNLQAAIACLKEPVDVVIADPLSITLPHDWILPYGNVTSDEQVTLGDQGRLEMNVTTDAITLYGTKANTTGIMHVEILKAADQSVVSSIDIDTYADTTATQQVLYTTTLDRDDYIVKVSNTNTKHESSTGYDIQLQNITLGHGFLNYKEASEVSTAQEVLQAAVRKALDIRDKNLLNGLAEKVVTKFHMSLQVAIDVLANSNATDKERLEAWYHLANAMHYLDFHADKTQLTDLITEASEIESNLDQYKEIGKAEFIAALTNARDVVNSDEVLDATIKATYDRLLTAKNNLVKLDGLQTEVLLFIIQEADKAMTNATYYEQNEAWAIFTTALADAKETLKTATTQAKLDAAATALSDAYTDIRLIANEDRLAALEDFSNKIVALNASLYSEEDYTIMQEAASYANQLLSSKMFTLEEYATFEELQETAMNIMKNNVLKPSEPDKTPGDVDNVVDVEKPGSQTNEDVVESTGTTKPATGDVTQLPLYGLLFVSSCVMLYKKKKNSK